VASFLRLQLRNLALTFGLVLMVMIATRRSLIGVV
jgi:hypothetical protein